MRVHGRDDGNIQAFHLPILQRFYRLELIAHMGETLTSMTCGTLALAQSPTVGVENFSVQTYFATSSA